MQVQIRRILVATDFSPTSNLAIRHAAAIADKFDAELHLLYVVVEPLPLPGPGGKWILPKDVLPGMIKKGEQDLATNVEGLQLDSSRQPLCVVKTGYPIEQILKYIDENQIDLVVMGTQGHRGLSRFLLGSVAEKVLRCATCPVLTVHPPATKS